MPATPSHHLNSDQQFFNSWSTIFWKARSSSAYGCDLAIPVTAASTISSTQSGASLFNRKYAHVASRRSATKPTSFRALKAFDIVGCEIPSASTTSQTHTSSNRAARKRQRRRVSLLRLAKIVAGDIFRSWNMPFLECFIRVTTAAPVYESFDLLCARKTHVCN